MMAASKADRAKLTGTVHRAYPVQLEVRGGSGSGVTIEGYASAVESPYEMFDHLGSYTETIRRGAFGKTLSENPQTQLLLNHGGLAMAYTRAGTLRLGEDSTGLHMSADLNTSRSDVRDMVTAIEDRNVDEMSFAFRVPSGKSQWSPDYDQRDILEVDIHKGDVSVVNFGANPATSVALRAHQALAERLPRARAVSLAKELRAGTLAPDDAAFLAQILGMSAAIDLIADELQEDIAERLGVPNPDDESDDMPAEDEQLARSPLSLYRAQAERIRHRA
jgi:HK97 family phage prohead protease